MCGEEEQRAREGTLGRPGTEGQVEEVSLADARGREKQEGQETKGERWGVDPRTVPGAP